MTLSSYVNHFQNLKTRSLCKFTGDSLWECKVHFYLNPTLWFQDVVILAFYSRGEEHTWILFPLYNEGWNTDFIYWKRLSKGPRSYYKRLREKYQNPCVDFPLLINGQGKMEFNDTFLSILVPHEILQL